MIISIPQAQLFFLALTRLFAMIIHVPVLGGENIPVQVRLGFGLVLTAVLIPWQPLPADAATLGLFGFAVAIGKEVLIGTLAGFAATLTFAAVQIAGEVMGMGSGFGSGRVFNPAIQDAGSAYSQLFLMSAMMVFLLINGHHLFIAAMQKTFQVLPVNGEVPFGSLTDLASMTSHMIAAGVQLALPVMAALTITDLALGLVARVAPQVQIYFLGLPLKVGFSLVAMGLLFTMAMPLLSNLFQSIGSRTLTFFAR